MKICDLTQFYSPVSGGVKRYLHEKIDYVQNCTASDKHVLVVPGPKSDVQVNGLSCANFTINMRRRWSLQSGWRGFSGTGACGTFASSAWALKSRPFIRTNPMRKRRENCSALIQIENFSSTLVVWRGKRTPLNYFVPSRFCSGADRTSFICSRLAMVRNEISSANCKHDAKMFPGSDIVLSRASSLSIIAPLIFLFIRVSRKHSVWLRWKVRPAERRWSAFAAVPWTTSFFMTKEIGRMKTPPKRSRKRSNR